MPEIVYGLCAITSVLCAGLLLRAYGRNRTALLMWSSGAFVGLAVNNVLLLVDLVIVTEVDLSFVRTLAALISMTVLVVGLILESS